MPGTAPAALCAKCKTGHLLNGNQERPGEEWGTLHAAECSPGRRVREVAPLVSTRISPESVNLGGKNNNEKEGCRDDWC